MAPRRVAAALTSDDTLEDSIRRDVLGAQDDGADDRTRNENPDDQDDEQADDQQQDDGTDDQGDDRQQDDGADDQQQDDGGEQRQPLRTERRRVAVRDRDDDYISPAAQQRIDEANRIANETAARLASFEQRFQQPQESVEQKAARRALMTPEAINEERLNEAFAVQNRTIAQVTFNAQNTADKASFDSLVGRNPQLNKFAADVERKHADMVRESTRTGAGIPTRDTVLKYLLGEKALELAQKAAPQQRARTDRVARQQARPGDNRSGVSNTRRRESTTEDRLDGVAL